MKKGVVLAVLMAVCGCAWAQQVETDTVPAGSEAAVEENVIGGRVAKPQPSGEANVLGAPVYYNIDGSVRGQSPLGDGLYHRPKHHYMNSLRNNFCTYFLEPEVLMGESDVALGLHFAYLPNRWGVYGSAFVGIDHDYLSLGPVVRLSEAGSLWDWQLYGGLMLGQSLGGELGFRCATPRKSGNFCWSSASMGMAVVDGRPYLTVGLSWELVAITSLAALLFVW